MEEATNVCQRLGGSQVCWSVFEWNPTAFAFYESLGASYTTDQRHMHFDI
jgi:hypothetical protein